MENSNQILHITSILHFYHDFHKNINFRYFSSIELIKRRKRKASVDINLKIVPSKVLHVCYSILVNLQRI